MMPPTSPSRRGNAALLVLVALLLVAGLVAWFALSGQPAGPAPSPLPTLPSAGPGAGVVPVDPDRPSSPSLDQPGPRTGEGSPVVRRGDDPLRFEGLGILRGSVDTVVGLDMPQAWTLVLEPSTSLAGSGRPESRRVEFTAGEMDFEVGDLPLGGYAVRAEALGCNGRAMSVLLERTSNAAYVMLQLSPAGFIEGRVEDDEGRPLESLAVWLFPGAPNSMGLYGSDGRRTESNVEGLWHFDDVVDGKYTLIFGAPDQPLIDPTAITFVAPSLTWPAPDLPPLLDVELLVTNGHGQPVGGARVRGTSPSPFDLESAPTGVVLVRNMPRGFLSVAAEHDVFGKGSLTLQLDDPDGDGVAGPYVLGVAEEL